MRVQTMWTASFDLKAPGLVALSLVGCLSLCLAARMQDDPPREGPGQTEAEAAKSALAAAAEALAERRATAGRPPSGRATSGRSAGAAA